MGDCGVLSQRACGSEFLDFPDSDPDLTERSFGFMRFVNHVGGGIRVVRRFLEIELSQAPAGETIRILDIGAGDCDIPLAIAKWASDRGRKVEFTCIDHNAKAIAMAQAKLASSDGRNIKLVEADAFSYQPTGQFDYAVGSMVFHHFTNDEIDRLIAHLRSFVRRALLINDLRRSVLNYLVCAILAAPADPQLRHDALLSVRRGFRPGELAKLLSKPDSKAVVGTAWFCRVAGVVRFDGKEGS
jgi:SAM-dependent methyltransferase